MHGSYGWVDTSPVGPLCLLASERGLSAILFAEPDECGRTPGLLRGVPRHLQHVQWIEDLGRVRDAALWLDVYFARRKPRPEDLPLPLDPGGTPFERRVWGQLTVIPYGQTTTYGTIAQRLGKPRAARAVGMANGRNPLPILVPCHRVVGASGRLTGFGGGLWRKQRLLDLERDA